MNSDWLTIHKTRILARKKRSGGKLEGIFFKLLFKLGFFPNLKLLKVNSFCSCQLKMAQRAQNTSTDDLLARILNSQRTLIEQNQKILQQGQQAREEEHERRRIAQDKIPLIVNVSTYY
jgi:signal transduction histidine kinase